MEWLRGNFAWASLWVVLFDLSVPEYETLRKDSPFANVLPSLGPRVVVREWLDGKGEYGTWPHLVHATKADMVDHDVRSATAAWKLFMKTFPPKTGTPPFPRADKVYNH